jgi:hypothetical protein
MKNLRKLWRPWTKAGDVPVPSGENPPVMYSNPHVCIYIRETARNISVLPCSPVIHSFYKIIIYLSTGPLVSSVHILENYKLTLKGLKHTV